MIGLARLTAGIIRSNCGDLLREASCRGRGLLVEGGLLKLLTFDTCGPEGSLALVDTERLSPMLDVVAMEGRTSSERLIPELRRSMSNLGWTLQDLRAVGVVGGPGSFTGVRVGLTAAKGLCEAAGLPMVMVSRLAVLAYKAGGLRGRTHALLDAGRGEFFYGRFEPGEEPIEALLEKDSILRSVDDGAVVAVCEDGVARALPELVVEFVDPLSAVDVVPLVKARVDVGVFDDVPTSDANYLRRTDLEVKARLEQRVRGG